MRQFLSILLTGFLIFSQGERSLAQPSSINNPFAKEDANTKTVLFAPITYIGYIEKGDKIRHSDSISTITAAILTHKTQQSQAQLKADSVLPALDTATSRSVQYELGNVVNDENFGNNKRKIALPPYLDSLLMESGHTYGMILYQNGFLRRKGNYSGQVWKSIGIGILTMGSYYTVPQKSSTNLYLFWLDGKKKTIECIALSEMAGKDPTDPKTLDKQMQALIENKNKKK